MSLIQLSSTNLHKKYSVWTGEAIFVCGFVQQDQPCGLGRGSGLLWRALIKCVCQESDN